MKMLIYGINFAPELTGIGKYTGELAEWLVSREHHIKVVTAPPYYPEWKVYPGFRNFYSYKKQGNLEVYRAPLFVPTNPKTLLRLLHLVSFTLTSFFILLRLIVWRPKVVFVVEPTLFCLPLALLYSKITGAKCILHIQDFEIDAMFGLGFMQGKQGIFAKIVIAFERWLMRRCDRVSSISDSMLQIAALKGVAINKALFFPNWVDTDFISPNADKMYFRQKWDIPLSTKVVLYSGNMGKKQGLEIVLEAAYQFRDRKDVLFLMVGHGAVKEELQEEAILKRLTNVRFEPLQPYECLPSLLTFADIHLVIQRKGAADIVLPSKLTGILSVGGYALITAQSDTELGLLTTKHPGIAHLVEPESADKLYEALEVILDKTPTEINKIAREYALQFLNKEAILARFERDIVSMLSDS